MFNQYFSDFGSIMVNQHVGNIPLINHRRDPHFFNEKPVLDIVYPGGRFSSFDWFLTISHKLRNPSIRSGQAMGGRAGLNRSI
jgi:hypothetical protein